MDGVKGPGGARGKRGATRSRPVNGDLFAHFGLTPKAAIDAPKAAPTPAAPCPRCTWLVTAETCPICDHGPATAKTET